MHRFFFVSLYFHRINYSDNMWVGVYNVHFGWSNCGRALFAAVLYCYTFIFELIVVFSSTPEKSCRTCQLVIRHLQRSKLRIHFHSQMKVSLINHSIYLINVSLPLKYSTPKRINHRASPWWHSVTFFF